MNLVGEKMEGFHYFGGCAEIMEGWEKKRCPEKPTTEDIEFIEMNRVEENSEKFWNITSSDNA